MRAPCPRALPRAMRASIHYCTSIMFEQPASSSTPSRPTAYVLHAPGDGGLGSGQRRRRDDGVVAASCVGSRTRHAAPLIPSSTQVLLEKYVRLVARKRHEERERQQQQQRQQQQRGGAPAPAPAIPATFLTQKGERLNSSRRKRRAYRDAHGKKKKKTKKRATTAAAAGSACACWRGEDCTLRVQRVRGQGRGQTHTREREGADVGGWGVGDAGLAPEDQGLCPAAQPGALDAACLAGYNLHREHRQEGPSRSPALRRRLLLQRRLTCPAGWLMCYSYFLTRPWPR